MSLLSAYQDLITSQHRDKPKYMATVSAVMKYSGDIFEVAVYLDDEFDIDLASGEQEDILGTIVGENRTLNFQPAKGLSPVLDNESYRILLKSKIAKNMWIGGIRDLSEIWATLFGNKIIIQDNQNMTIDIVVIGINDQITKDMIKNGLIVPKPQSVSINYYFSDYAVFGYDIETESIRGYDHADWMNQEPEVSFSYDTENESKFMCGYDEGKWT